MQVFSNSALHITTVDQIIYTCLSNEDCTIHNLLITNNSVGSVLINLALYKGAEHYHVIPADFVLKSKNTLEMKPINLVAGDILKVRASIINTCDCVASMLREVRDF